MSKAEDIRYDVEVVNDDPIERMHLLNKMLNSHSFAASYLDYHDGKLDHLTHPLDSGDISDE